MYQRACCAPLSALSLANPGLAFLRYAFLLRLEDRGRPSVVCPFAGPRVHWTLGQSPAHPWQARLADARLVPAHPPPYEGGTVSPTGDYLLSGFHPRTTSSFLCVPKERNRKKRHPGLCARELRGFPRSALVSDGPRKGHSLALARTRGIHSAPLRACSSPSRVARLE